MKLTVYDKSNSHPALTYKGKRIITVCRDGSMYLSRILSRELSLHAGNRLCIARDEDRPKDWYMFVSDDENGFTIWNDPRCARFSNSFIAGMILDAAKVEKSAGFMVAREPVKVDGRLCYRIILDNPIPKGSKSYRYEISPISERKNRGHPEEGKRSDLRVSLFSCGHRQITTVSG